MVAPISASYPVLTMILSTFTGERLTPVRLVGLLLTIIGVIVVARGEQVEPMVIRWMGKRGRRKRGEGWVGGVFGGVLRNYVLVAGHSCGAALGSAPSVWMIRLTSVVGYGGSDAGPGRNPGPYRRRKMCCGYFFVGLLDTRAYVLIISE